MKVACRRRDKAADAPALPWAAGGGDLPAGDERHPGLAWSNFTASRQAGRKAAAAPPRGGVRTLRRGHAPERTGGLQHVTSTCVVRARCLGWLHAGRHGAPVGVVRRSPWPESCCRPTALLLCCYHCCSAAPSAVWGRSRRCGVRRRAGRVRHLGRKACCCVALPA